MGPANGGSLVGQKLGDYQLQSLLGTGGMAEVYRALELPLGREVAVKVLPAALAADPNYVARFRTEARRVAKLRHPNIVEVYTFNSGEHGGLLYLVMPVLRESLRDVLDQEGKLPIPEAVRVVTEIASGLEVAHGIGLVHRDVKPENILLDKDGRALLTDFGIAREVLPFHRQGNAAQTLAATGLPVGTPEYMAPEQLRGGAVDQRADIYALGAVLYELLTGRVPHEAETPYEVAALVLTEPLIPPSQRNPDISPELERVVMRALEKIPTKRYPDVRAFAMELNAAARAGKTTMRGMAGGWQRKTARIAWNPEVDGPLADIATESLVAVGSPQPRGFVSRNRWFLMLAAAAILLASLCGGGSLMMLNGFTLGGIAPANLFGPTATQTIQALAAATDAPTATPLPTATPIATATPVSTATPQPPPPSRLTISPSPLVLVPSGRSCTATQTITNNSHQQLGWQWTDPKLGTAYTFTLNGGFPKYWPPQDMDPGLAPGKSDTLLVRVSGCADKAKSMSITAQDSLGHTYTFDMNIAQ